MSDFDDYESSEDGDFSASEDEWVPGKNERESSDEDDGDFLFVEEQSPSPIINKTRSAKQKCKQPRKLSLSSSSSKSKSLRSKLFAKYKDASAILHHARYNKSRLNNLAPQPSTSKASASNDDDSDSDSSVDDHLVNADNLDLQSPFFAQSNDDASAAVPKFECNTGLRLSDSEDDSDRDEAGPSSIQSLTKSSESKIDFSEHRNLAAKLENAKGQFSHYFRPANQDSSTDVSELLALGEISKKESKSKKPAVVKRKADSDSDWEDVKDHEPIQDVQFTIKSPSLPVKKKTSKEEEFEAALKRQINRRKREIQISMHKVHILGWIAHGNYVNSILNNSELMKICLNLLPSAQCYPKEQTNVKYFEQITKWYRTKVILKEETMYPKIRTPALPVSLGLQIKTKSAICRRDFLFIFIILLRSLGIHCRLVVNLVTVPIRPLASELCSIKPKTEKAETPIKPSKPTISGKEDEKSKSVSKDNTKKSKKETEKDKNESKKRQIDDTKAGPSKISPSQQKFNSDKQNSLSAKLDSNLKKIREKKAGNSLLVVKTSPISRRTRSKSKEIDISERSTTQFSAQKRKAEKIDDDEAKKKKGELEQIKKRTENKTQTDSIQEPSTSRRESSKTKEVSSKSTESSKKTKEDPVKSNEKSSKQSNAESPKQSKNKSTKQSKEEVSKQSKIEPSKNTKKDSTKQFSMAKESNEENPVKDQNSPSISGNKLNVLQSPIANRTRKRIINRTAKPKLNSNGSIPQLDGSNDVNRGSSRDGSKKKKPNLSKLKQAKRGPETKNPTKSSKKEENLLDYIEEDEDENDSDYEPSPSKKAKNNLPSSALLEKPLPKSVTNLRRLDRRVLSTDDEDDETKTNRKNDINMWVEVFCEAEIMWIPIDLFKTKVNSIDSLRKTATKPIGYTFAWNNNKTIKDVSARYCPQWHTTTRKNRVDQHWLDVALGPFKESRNARNIAEDRELNKVLLKESLPKSISEFKNHPLYVLKRHLLKFEAIYPSNALTLGYIRDEPVYARDCVHTLHSREIWVKQARVVKPAETPYKIVKARPKYNRATGTMMEAAPLEIFGYWQTQPYVPPTAENGIVPRNAYGNVELFKPEMLPHGTVHLQLPSLNRTCKKLGIDCAQAVVGFDFHSGSSHPTFDGFVICEEFAKQVVEQWWEDQREADRKEKEKYLDRVYGNWKKLIKGLLIRRRLQLKYNFKGDDDSKENAKTDKKPQSKGKRKK